MDKYTLWLHKLKPMTESMIIQSPDYTILRSAIPLTAIIRRTLEKCRVWNAEAKKELYPMQVVVCPSCGGGERTIVTSLRTRDYSTLELIDMAETTFILAQKRVGWCKECWEDATRRNHTTSGLVVSMPERMSSAQLATLLDYINTGAFLK